MGCVWKMMVVFGVLSAGIAFFYNSLTSVPQMPDLKSRWWGPGTPRKDDPAIKPFKINVPQERLMDLKKRLENVQLQQPLEGINFEYGFNTNYLKKVINFWLNDYDWRSREKYLNSFPQFTTQVNGLQMHYIHVKPTKSSPSHKVYPLLLIHGWPGSVREFYELIPLLTTPEADKDFVFEVIVPSLPGYGFSEGASKPGLSASQVAILMKDLMEKIGFNKYYTQGGDWGAVIVQHMATFYPEKILGVHSNACFLNTPLSQIRLFLSSIFPSYCGITETQKKQLFPMSNLFSNTLLESGYMHIQATKPDTVGVALRDSPVGLAAYILEKFSTWTNLENRNLPDGGLTKKFSLTNLLDNIMIYWISDSITTSVRLYSETFTKAELGLQLERIPISVPAACAQFPEELSLLALPEFILREKYHNLVNFKEMAAGGHFAAFEEPKLVATNIYESVKKMQMIKRKK